MNREHSKLDGASTSNHDDIFVTTRWTMVLAAADRSTPQAGQALEEICQLYWYPLYAYIRRHDHSPENAEDLTQEFFRQLVEHHWIGDADRNKGKLRAFLMTALKNFMAKEWRKASAKKRGGGQLPLSIDTGIAEGRYASTTKSPSIEAEALFDHEWALTLLELTMQCLRSEYGDAGKQERFAVLKDGLFAPHQDIDYSALAESLDLTVAATQVAVHRMRKRFRELYREEVAKTLPPDANLDEEIRYLAESLAKE
ncbi:MAG: sigma-70 family RNA polymerase sigma factor [Deltaproteobacteria bacterium]|nr:sigma-70 family RNA polymerase sigma factor [Deltaproteobacteria bacterium]MBN2783801.1 sigma-70 family RNA polymerase sigma factor [Pontiellaceae bacterium]